VLTHFFEQSLVSAQRLLSSYTCLCHAFLIWDSELYARGPGTSASCTRNFDTLHAPIRNEENNPETCSFGGINKVDQASAFFTHLAKQLEKNSDHHVKRLLLWTFLRLWPPLWRSILVSSGPEYGQPSPTGHYFRRQDLEALQTKVSHLKHTIQSTSLLIEILYFIFRMDLHEDNEKNLVTASFEFPGISKENIQIDVHNTKLTVCWD